jgi:phage terminase large subunit
MQTAQPTLELQVEPDAVADWFYPLLTNADRYILLWGGRDSTKSDGWALKLLLDCIHLDYFKCLLLRKVADTVAGSQWATLKSVAEREGIDHLFFFGISPCVIPRQAQEA